MAQGDARVGEGNEFRLCQRCIRPSNVCWATQTRGRPLPARFPIWAQEFRSSWGDGPTLPSPERVQRAYCVFGRIATTRSTAAAAVAASAPTRPRLTKGARIDLTARLVGLYFDGVRPWQEELDHWTRSMAPIATRILKRLPQHELREYWVEEALWTAAGRLLLGHRSLFWVRRSPEPEIRTVVKQVTVQIRDRLREDRKRLAVLPAELTSSSPTPAHQAEVRELLSSLTPAAAEALAALEPRLREVLQGILSGRTHEELGLEMGCSRQLIGRLLKRSIDRLRHELAQGVGGTKVIPEKMDFFFSPEVVQALAVVLLQSRESEAPGVAKRSARAPI